jgi:PAS domain S-box-containing protein
MAISHVRTRRPGGIAGIDDSCRRHLWALNDLGIAAIVTDASGPIAAWNSHAARLLGDGAGLTVGSPLWSPDPDASLLADASAAREIVEIAGGAGRWKGEAELIVDGARTRAEIVATRIGTSGERSAQIIVAILELLGRRSDGEIWQPIVDSLASRLALLNERGDILAVNETWRRAALESGSDSDYIGWNYFAACEASPDPEAPRVLESLRRVAAGELDVFEHVYQEDDAPAGQRWVLLRGVPYAGDRPGWLVVSRQDVTEARTDKERAHLQATVLDQLDVAIHTTDLDHTILSWNAAAEQLYGWTAEEAIGRRTDELMLAAVGPVDPGIRRAINLGHWEGQLTLGLKDGSTFPAFARTSVTTDLLGAPTTIAWIVLDISEKLQSQRELKAARDHLRAVTDSIGEGMFTLDLDGRLTYMNPAAEQTLGWTHGEVNGSVVQELIQSRHLDAVRSSVERSQQMKGFHEDEVVRIEDDVFIRADGIELPVAYTASPFATDHGVEGLVVVFQDITERKAEARRMSGEMEKVKWVRRIQDALANERFVLFAQPIVDLRDDGVVQHELLIRMRDPNDPAKLISPGAFLPVAEEYALIGDIDRWVIDQAARLAARGMAVELNVSAASIGDRRLIPHIESAISRHGADPAMLVFEITETALVGDEREGRQFVERMQDLGCKVALDDFGTGYGGFTYLKQLPIDFLKIDIEFVRDLVTNEASRNVVEAIVTLAQRFGLKTVGEGVEDSDILQLLSELGVDYAQGYHIGRPAPLDERVHSS